MAPPVYPHFPFTILAWQQVVTDLDNEQAAALHFLIGHYCITGGILPFLDDRAMARICRMSLRRWVSMRPKLAPKFPGDGWTWPEIDQRIDRWRKTSVERSLASKKRKPKHLLPLRQGLLRPK